MADKVAGGVALLHVCAGEKTFKTQIDLFFKDGRVFAVFEWGPDDLPAVMVELDPKYLHDLKGWDGFTHIYEMPIRDPRTALH